MQKLCRKEIQNPYWIMCCLLHGKRQSVSLDSQLVPLGNETILATQIWPLWLSRWAFSTRGSREPGQPEWDHLVEPMYIYPHGYGHFVHRIISLFLLRSENPILLQHPSPPSLIYREQYVEFFKEAVRHLLNLLQCMTPWNPWRVWTMRDVSGYA